MKQIEQFIQHNLEIMEENKKRPEEKQKAYLEVSKKPVPPQQRFFRNLDILRSMVRGWFELEYKKTIKKNVRAK